MHIIINTLRWMYTFTHTKYGNNTSSINVRYKIVYLKWYACICVLSNSLKYIQKAIHVHKKTQKALCVYEKQLLSGTSCQDLKVDHWVHTMSVKESPTLCWYIHHCHSNAGRLSHSSRLHYACLSSHNLAGLLQTVDGSWRRDWEERRGSVYEACNIKCRHAEGKR